MKSIISQKSAPKPAMMKYPIYSRFGLLLSLLLFSGNFSGCTQQTTNTSKPQPKVQFDNFVYRKL